MRPVADEQPAVDLDAQRLQPVELLEQLAQVEHRAVADDDALVGTEHARRHVVQRVALLADGHGVTGVGSTLETGHDVEAFGEQVDDLALALVAPLGPDDGDVTCALTFAARSGGTPNHSTQDRNGGRQGDRTLDLGVANAALSHLS